MTEDERIMERVTQKLARAAHQGHAVMFPGREAEALALMLEVGSHAVSKIGPDAKLDDGTRLADVRVPDLSDLIALLERSEATSKHPLTINGRRASAAVRMTWELAIKLTQHCMGVPAS